MQGAGSERVSRRRALNPEPGSPGDARATIRSACLAWELAQSPVVVPIPGASRPESIIDSAAAPDVVLSPEDMARLDATQPG